MGAAGRREEEAEAATANEWTVRMGRRYRKDECKRRARVGRRDREGEHKKAKSVTGTWVQQGGRDGR